MEWKRLQGIYDAVFLKKAELVFTSGRKVTYNRIISTTKIGNRLTFSCINKKGYEITITRNTDLIEEYKEIGYVGVAYNRMVLCQGDDEYTRYLSRVYFSYIMTNALAFNKRLNM